LSQNRKILKIIDETISFNAYRLIFLEVAELPIVLLTHFLIVKAENLQLKVK